MQDTSNQTADWITYSKISVGDCVKFNDSGWVWLNRAQAEKDVRPFLVVASVESPYRGYRVFVTEDGSRFVKPANAKALVVR